MEEGKGDVINRLGCDIAFAIVKGQLFGVEKGSQMSYVQIVKSRWSLELPCAEKGAGRKSFIVRLEVYLGVLPLPLCLLWW